MNIRDIDHEDIKEFLQLNNIEISNIEEDYKHSWHLMISENTKFTNSIVEWMKAHQLLDANIPTFKRSQLINLSVNEINKLSQLLTIEIPNLYYIKSILTYLDKLENDLLKTNLISLKGTQKLYGSRLEHAPVNLIYIGRQCTMGGWNLSSSTFANPYKVKELGRKNTLQQYKKYIINRLKTEPQLQRLLDSYAGCTLACWCGKNEACHGNILIELIEGK